MEDFIKEHGTAVVYIVVIFCGSLLSLLGWFLRNDRKNFMDSIEKTNKRINECKEEIDERIDKIETEVNAIVKNYNNKFQMVYDKQDEIKEVINSNHIAVINAIHKVDMKTPDRK